MILPASSPRRRLWVLATAALWAVAPAVPAAEEPEEATAPPLEWSPLPDLPDPLGVAGPFAGVHNDALLVAGGANFPKPIWESEKTWHDPIHVLIKRDDGYQWTSGGTLPRPVAYGAAVSTPHGVVCMGGNDGRQTFAEVFVLRWDSGRQEVTRIDFPPLPRPCAHGQAVAVGDVIYLAGGQSGNGLDSAMRNFWALDLSKRGQPEAFAWQELEAWPGPARAFNITAAQHNGYDHCVYVMGGRREEDGTIRFLADVWEFNTTTRQWRRRADSPRPAVAGTGIGFGQSHIFVLGGDDGALFAKAAELGDQHPGFIKEALSYHTITDTWTSAGPIPLNHVTTIPVMWDGRIVVASGEVRPRVRTPKIWSIAPVASRPGFGAVNYTVLFGYLLAMVGVGVYFTRRNKGTDDYFRGGKHLPWWAAGCSIFATMLSSITFMSIPAKAFAQDWVYAVGNLMIVAVAPVAVYLALPFFRRIDATSAYEYLERRFNRGVRLFASGLFTLFHVFRMAIVMSLAGLALAVVTPLSPAQSVILMGVLSILYCTLGGVEAVIWTDTIQTAVLLGGAVLCLALMIMGSDGGLSGAVATAAAGEKLRLANFHLDPTSASLAIWVVILGGLGQNFSSYTSDQAVVQRYMTTPDARRAATSIWLAAGLAAVATVLFFGLGSGLYAFYKAHPEKLDPTFTTDQIFPLFILHETFPGVAGLIVAGIFAAAQSTVSTSMNSTATTVVTDFLRPFRACGSEAAYLRAARGLTLGFGLVGTLLGLVFVDPEIRSLFDSFIKVVGIFMGVLGGLFALGMLTRRASGPGALVGVVAGAGVMLALPIFSQVTGYLYPAIGISVCFAVGLVASLILPARRHDLTGLTVFTQERP